MRKIYLILAMMLVSVLTASATVIWPDTEGQTTTFEGWTMKEGDSQILLSKDKLSGAAVGDQIVVHFTCLSTGTWFQVLLYDQKVSAACAQSGGVSGSTSYTFTIDDKVLEQINAGGVVVTGSSITVSQVEFNKASNSSSDEPKYGKVWPSTDGQTTTFTGWNKSESDPDVLLTQDLMGIPQVGDKIVVKFTVGSGWAAINLWNSTVSTNYYDSGSVTGKTEVSIEVTDDIIAAIKAGGVKVTGSNVTVTEVDLEKAPQEGEQYGSIWEQGTGTACIFDNGWNQKGTAISIDKSAFSKANAGDKVVFTFTVTSSSADDACLELWRADYGGNIGSLTAVITSTDMTTATFEITDEALALLKAGGLMPTGRNVTVTKVELVKGDAKPSLPANAIWPETVGAQTTFANWAITSGDAISIPASKFTGIAAGDKVIVKVTDVAAAGGHLEMWKSDYSSLVDAAYNVNFTSDKTEYEFVVTADAATELAANGCVITGNNVTVTEVDRDPMPTTNAINAINASNVKKDAWYNLQGQRVNAPVHGVYIHNGRKVIKK